MDRSNDLLSLSIRRAAEKQLTLTTIYNTTRPMSTFDQIVGATIADVSAEIDR